MSDDFKILWAEDESLLRELICELLAVEGFNCAQASDGLEAQKLLHQDNYSLLIADFNMPGLTGDSLLFWCRENEIHIPVIFVTGHFERKDSELLALQDCCASVLQKPFAIEQLVGEIENAKSRNHEFHCKGYKIEKEAADFINFFPNQHQL